MRWWNLLNKALFDGKLLPPQKITVKNYRAVHGNCWPMAEKGHVHLQINSEFMDRKEFIAILAHEMIHQWQWTDESAKGKMTHGDTFWQWESTLKRVLNLPLAISY